MSDELPLFPAKAPEVFSDRQATVGLFDQVMTDLAGIVEVDQGRLGDPTPCAAYTVSELRHHVLAWLSFFATALNDPDASSPRPDPDTWTLADDEQPAGVVERAAASIESAINNGVADRVVVMSQARMAGDAVLAMALGEYLVHGWDLAVATDRPWPSAGAVEGPAAALAFLETTVAPEYRGEDSGFFGQEVEAAGDASQFQRLLCFAGRDPSWTAAAPAAPTRPTVS